MMFGNAILLVELTDFVIAFIESFTFTDDIDELHQEALAQIQRELEVLSYQRVLDRGFTLVTDENGHAVTDAADVKAGQPLDIRFRDGSVPAVAGAGGEGKKPTKSGRKAPTKQGSLF